MMVTLLEYFKLIYGEHVFDAKNSLCKTFPILLSLSIYDDQIDKLTKRITMR